MIDVLRALVGGWHAEPVPVLTAAAALLLYDRGSRRQGDMLPGRARSRSQALCLVAGIGVILIALLSPLDGLALQLQWVHMAQHVLLLVVAPPLVVLARPWDLGLAAVGPLLRRPLAATQTALSTPAGRLAALLAAVLLFVGVLWLWHIPGLYDLTLRNGAVHDTEHTAFLAVGLLFWTVALPGAQPRPSPGLVGRSAVVLAGMVGSWMLAVYIGYAPTVLFAYSGAGGLTAMADQQIAAGVMWVPGSVPFVIALVVLVARWFENDARAVAAEAGLRGEAGV